MPLRNRRFLFLFVLHNDALVGLLCGCHFLVGLWAKVVEYVLVVRVGALISCFVSDVKFGIAE